ncbi:nitroreductase family protein [Zea mays]|uniref:Nitroreductase family protein n=2 Tax=Zea mays TaxID=4577 RepID=A0A1D6N5J5_MAIZE|nr:nitroreductase family protein [Zea mays]
MLLRHRHHLLSRPRRSFPLAALGCVAMSTSSSPSSSTSTSAAADYHCRTKHSPTAGYARGPGRLDWANQPNPFLRFSPAPPLPLPNPPPLAPVPYPALFHSPPPPPQPLTLDSLSALLFHSLALSAWKSAGLSTWSLRVNPSSGNLHPTEAHLVFPHPREVDRLAIAHYAPRDHLLEARATAPIRDCSAILSAPGMAILALSSVFWREAWKYGERALRYCNHDVGHALAAVALAAATLGWDARLLDGLSDEDLGRLVGVEKGSPAAVPEGLLNKVVKGKARWVERQHPDCAVLLFPVGSEPEVDYGRISEELKVFDGLEWVGKANALSNDHVVWDVIYRTAEQVKKHGPAPGERFFVMPWQKSPALSKGLYKELTVQEVVRQRRSAVDMDGVHVMGRDTFYQMLMHCLPSGEVGSGERQGEQSALPFRVLPWEAEVHAALFVHRVSGLHRGIYFLVRNEEHFDALQRAMRQDFEWVQPEGCPDGLPLYRLMKGDCQKFAMQISCFQEIASHGCFSLGMIARFEPVLHEKGEWMYPRLFWETGILGQVLYLEAHAIGISATGIGCYFDDTVHEALGLKGLDFQSMYHFTVGAPVLDKRIMSLPAYPGPGIDA